MGDIAQAYVQVIPSAKGMKGKLTEALGGESKSAGLSAGASFGANLVSTCKKILVAAGIGESIKKSITDGAALQQSLGGIETLFKENADRVIANADQAYRTCGLSANRYMEQVTSFSASLLQSLGGDTSKAANVADMALTDMYGFGSGGGTGASLTVNALSGCTVTVSKDGKTKTKTAGADGVAVFKGLATGQWTVTITDGEQTAQKTVTITADYSTAITFFSATIHVTYPAGSTCTATDGVTTLTAPDTSGTWDCVVPNAGTWTVVVQDKGLPISTSITSNGQVEDIDMTKYWIFRSGVGAVVPIIKATGPNATLNIGTDYIKTSYSYGNSGEAGFCTNDRLNLSKFKALKAEINCENYYTSGPYEYPGKIAVFSDHVTDSVSAGVVSSTGVDANSANTVYSLDVSALYDDYYVGFVGITTSKIFNMWLEV